jgi:hypothetical protein
MAFIRGVVMTKRELTGNIRQPTVVQDYSGEWSDISEQIDSDLNNLQLAVWLAEVSTTVGTAILADTRAFGVGWQRFSGTLRGNEGSVTAGNWNDALTTLDRTAFVTWMTTNWGTIPQRFLDALNAQIPVGMLRKDAAVGLVKILRRWS